MPDLTQFKNPPCPHLPQIPAPLDITHTRQFRKSCAADYHTACLELAQSLWRSGSPAQAILQLDKSFMASHPDHELPHHISYSAILWIIQHAPKGQFLGNPVRHFQHLASRMNHAQPQAELRIWRAWACLHISEIHSPAGNYPRDNQQIERESLTIPALPDVLRRIKTLANSEEAEFVQKLADQSLN